MCHYRLNVFIFVAFLKILFSSIFYFQVLAGTLDLYGNEGDYFLVLLSPYLSSIVRTVCCLDTCPSKFHSVTSMSVILSQPVNQVSSIFSKSIDVWQNPPNSNCGRKFARQPPHGVSCYEDIILDDQGGAQMSWHCAGIRASTPRTMVNLKSFLIFSVDLLSRGGLLTITHLPVSIFLYGRTLTLFGTTLWNGGHYISIFCYKNDWYLYDGLKEYTRKGSGILFSPTMFSEPLGYRLSYVVYCV